MIEIDKVLIFALYGIWDDLAACMILLQGV
jgi:hypothetical protein